MPIGVMSYGSSIYFRSQGYSALPPPPHSSQEVLLGKTLGETLVRLLPTQIWPGSSSGLRRASPEMHPDPQRPTLKACHGGKEKGKREGKAGAGDPAGQHNF